MKRAWRRTGKVLATAGCLAVCLWCGGSSLVSLGQQQKEMPELSPGSRAEAAGFPEASGVEALLSGQEETEQGLLLFDDGVVPFHNDQLPGATVTPDPERSSAPVEEISAGGGQQVANFLVRDTTESGTDLEAELEQQPSVQLYGDGRPEILIYHTHTSEAYVQRFTDFYYTDMETRTQNTDRSVVAVGEELKAALEEAGFGVIHDTTVNDTLFNGSYSRSWEVLQKNLTEYPSIQVTIDVHRDSMTTQEGVKYKPTAVIGGRKAAQIMFLAGCNADGSWDDFPNWKENLHLILRAQQKGTELYPELIRPLNFSNNKYNMNATSGSMLVEIGTEVNTVAEAKYSARMLGEILSQVFDDLKIE